MDRKRCDNNNGNRRANTFYFELSMLTAECSLSQQSIELVESIHIYELVAGDLKADSLCSLNINKSLERMRSFGLLSIKIGEWEFLVWRKWRVKRPKEDRRIFVFFFVTTKSNLNSKHCSKDGDSGWKAGGSNAKMPLHIFFANTVRKYQ